MNLDEIIKAKIENEANNDGLVEVTAPNAVNIFCGCNHYASVDYVGKVLRDVLVELKDVLNIPGNRVIFINGTMETDPTRVLNAGDVIDITEPAGQKG